MYNALQYSHQLLKKLVQENPNGLFVDATLGNGNDSRFLLSLKEFKGKLLGFDIQQIALDNSKKHIDLLQSEIVATYHFILDSHANIEKHLNNEQIQGAIFNLGYLPGGDHNLTTSFNSTFKAINSILDNLVIHGQIIIVIYSGHKQGMNEKNNLLEELEELPQENYQVLTYQFINQKNNPPILLVIERIK